MERFKRLAWGVFALALAWVMLAAVGVAYADDGVQKDDSAILKSMSDEESPEILRSAQDDTPGTDPDTPGTDPDMPDEMAVDAQDDTPGTGPDTPGTDPNAPDDAAEDAQAVPDDAQLVAASEAQVDMYRLYNPNSGEHFYTSAMDERRSLTSLGWRFEGVGWVAPAVSDAPVYRLYNPNAGDHHYTLAIAERDGLVALGWSYEGIGWYSDTSKTVALLREYNPNAVAGAHNFTTSAEEDAELAAAGWSQEGVAWYALDYGKAVMGYIYLDAGHGLGSSNPGQYDPGAGGNGYEEAKLTAELVTLTAQYAQELYGIAVYTNIDADVQYWNRQADAASLGCTSLVSIHFNASDGGGTGTESYIHSSLAAAGSDMLQSIMHKHLVAGVGLRDRGMKEAVLSVCNGSSMGIPATLLEVCFIDNSYDMQVYMKNKDKVARELAKGLAEAAEAGF